MRAFHFNRHYSIYGVIFLSAVALSVYFIAQHNNMVGSVNMTVTPLLLAIFVLGYFTGRPSLVVSETHFRYRRAPFGRLNIVYLEDIRKVKVSGKEILVFCYGQADPIRISGASFSRQQLPEVIHYFLSLRSSILA